jgi:hypothetical protein
LDAFASKIMSNSADPIAPPRRWLATAIIVGVGAAMAGWTWDNGPDPIVDFGRECYVPWRITQQDILYRDIHYFNGPLSPHFNALVFQLLGTSLRALKMANLLVIGLATALIYTLVRRIAGRLAATSAAVAFLSLFAFARFLGVANYNWLTPYSHELTHGMMLSLAALVCLSKLADSGRTVWAAAGGAALGLVFLTKAEVFLAAASATFVGLALVLWLGRGHRLRIVLSFAASFLLPVAVCFLLLLRDLTVHQAAAAIVGAWAFVGDSALTGLPYFRKLAGTLDLRASLFSIAGMSIAWSALILPATLVGLWTRPKRAVVAAILVALLSGAAVFAMRFKIDWESIARPLPLLAGAAVVVSAIRTVRFRDATHITTLSLAVFALMSCLKILFNVRISHYGFALSMPAGMLLIVAAIAWLPAWVQRRNGAGVVPLLSALSILIVVVGFHLWMISIWFSSETEMMAPGTGDAFWMDRRGLPMRALVNDLSQNTAASDSLVMIPDGLIANYLARRRNPVGYLNFTPPAMIMFGETNIRQAFASHPPDYIAIVNDDSVEYGARYFGRDFGQELMRWIQDRYVRIKVYGASIDEPEKIGGITLFKARPVNQSPP